MEEENNKNKRTQHVIPNGYILIQPLAQAHVEYMQSIGGKSSYESEKKLPSYIDAESSAEDVEKVITELESHLAFVKLKKQEKRAPNP